MHMMKCEGCKMNKKILFSPVGGTDPIRYLRDGSLLHICRHYQPDVVYLYLSHEMMENHKTDNRYVASINRLGEYLHHNFEVHVIEKDELIDVQQYDVFFNDFRQEIRKIKTTMESGDELLLNMASGTPAMKSALMIIATLTEYKFRAIQVSTPQKKMNSEHEDRMHYDIDVNWELNEDNDENADNRCTEVKCFNLMRLLKIEMIKKHIKAYDYTAALTVANEIKEDISEDAYTVLQIADARVKLNRRKISVLMAGKNYDIYPIKDGNKQKIFEYALVLQTKIAKQEFADFIRGITPLVVDLLEEILKNECGITLADCCTINGRDGVRKWNKDKLEQAGLMTVLNEAYRTVGGFRVGPVYSSHIAKLIFYKSEDMVLRQKVEEIATIEGAVRNVAAHEIVSVTDEWFQEKTTKSARDIFELIKYLTRKAGINAKGEDWQSYDKMNAMIADFMEL